MYLCHRWLTVGFVGLILSAAVWWFGMPTWLLHGTFGLAMMPMTMGCCLVLHAIVRLVVTHQKRNILACCKRHCWPWLSFFLCEMVIGPLACLCWFFYLWLKPFETQAVWRWFYRQSTQPNYDDCMITAQMLIESHVFRFKQSGCIVQDGRWTYYEYENPPSTSEPS